MNAKEDADLEIRTIQASDNIQVAQVIRTVMTTFDCVGEGFSIADPEVDHMYEAYANDKSRFYVVANADTVFGCGGIGPLIGGDDKVCELKKMYFYPEIRGRGFGSQLMDRCLQKAINLGYKKCYIETLGTMSKANKLYKSYGFKKLERQIGNTGHNGCDTFYIKDL